MVGTQALVEPQRKHNFPNGCISMTQVTPTCSVARRGRIPATGLSEKAPESRGYPLFPNLRLGCLDLLGKGSVVSNGVAREGEPGPASLQGWQCEGDV